MQHPPPQTPLHTPLLVLNRETLARQTFDDPALAQDILILLAQTLKAALARLPAIPAGSEAADLAHTLKGTALSVGAEALAQAARTAEVQAKTPEWPQGRQTLILALQQLQAHLPA